MSEILQVGFSVGTSCASFIGIESVRGMSKQRCEYCEREIYWILIDLYCNIDNK